MRRANLSGYAKTCGNRLCPGTYRNQAARQRGENKRRAAAAAAAARGGGAGLVKRPRRASAAAAAAAGGGGLGKKKRKGRDAAEGDAAAVAGGGGGGGRLVKRPLRPSAAAAAVGSGAAASAAEVGSAAASACCVVCQADAAEFVCGFGTHSVCRECISGWCIAQCDEENRGAFQTGLRCCGHKCGANYEPDMLRRLLSDEAYKAWDKARFALHATQCYHDAAASAAASKAAEAAAGEGTAAREAVLAHLTLVCPTCGQAFVDFDACSALQCSRCDTHFCAWCLGVSADSHLNHQHVGTCRDNPVGELFASLDRFNEVQAERRKVLVRAELLRMPEALRFQTLASVQRELTDLGIQLTEADLDLIDLT